MKKALKITGIVLLAAILLLFGTQLWLSYKIRQIAEEKIYEKTQGRVRAEIGSVSVWLIGRTVKLKDIRITTDTTIIPATESFPGYINSHIHEICVKGIHYKKQDSLIHLQARLFRLNIPALDFRRTLLSNTSHSKPATAFTLEVKETQIRLGDINVEQTQGKDTSSYVLQNFYAQTEQFQYTSSPDSSIFPCSCESLETNFTSFRYLFAEKSQLLAIDTFSLNKEGTFSVRSTQLLPQYSKAEFAQKAPNHTDWTQIEVKNLNGHHFRLHPFLSQGLLHIDSIAIAGANIQSFKNRQIEQTPKSKRLFYESVQQFPYKLNIPVVQLENINVTYQELSKNGTSPGTITFQELQGVFRGLTNMVNPEHPYFTLDAEGELMNQGKLQATFLLPTDNLNPHFNVKGQLGPMPLEALNQMIVPLVKIKITEGKVEKLTFDINGNSHTAEVDMLFLYNNLKIRIVKEKDGVMKTRSFLTNIVNGIIIDENNPGRKGPREVHGKAERDLYRSQFNYLWRTLLAGLKASIGL